MSKLSVVGEDNHEPLDCCSSNGYHVDDSELLPICFPIDIPSNDSFIQGKFH